MQERQLENYEAIPADIWQSVLDRVSPSLNGLFSARQTCKLFNRVVDERLKHKPVIGDYSELKHEWVTGSVSVIALSDAEDKLAMLCINEGDYISFFPLKGKRDIVSCPVPPLLPPQLGSPIYYKMLFRDNDRQLLAFSTGNNWVDVWDVQQRVLIERRQLSHSNYLVFFPSVLRDGGLLFACTNNNNNDWYLEWLNRDFESVRVFPLHDVQGIRSIVLSVDESKVAITYGVNFSRSVRIVSLQPTISLGNPLLIGVADDSLCFMPDNLHFMARTIRKLAYLTIFTVEAGAVVKEFQCGNHSNIRSLRLNKARTASVADHDGITVTQLGEKPQSAYIRTSAKDLLLFARQKIVQFCNRNVNVWIPRAKQLTPEPVNNSLRK